jgi:hypothetical protein
MDKSYSMRLLGGFEGLVAPHSLVIICTSVADSVVVFDLDLVTALLTGLPNAIAIHIAMEISHILRRIEAVWIVVTEVIVVVGCHNGG